MWKNIILIAAVITLSSCGAKRKGVEASKESKEVVLGKSEAVSYKSLGNGVASISLELYQNNTFKFDFNSIPQPDTEEKAVNISDKGTYTSEGDWKTLYYKHPKLSLTDKFDKQFGDANIFKVIDNQNVKINNTMNAFPIWGYVCDNQY